MEEKELKSYNVYEIENNQLNITGKGDDNLWNKAEVLSEFSSPWDDEEIKKIVFKALWDKEYLFFFFRVYDSDIYIDNKDDSNRSINNSDRVELFFRPNSSLNPYYCLEIDPTPRIMDFKAFPNKNFDFGWNWPKDGLFVKSNTNSKGFCVEGKISINSLKELDLIHDSNIETGIFRAKYHIRNNSHNKAIWITWVDPNTKSPNFHIRSSFGNLKLVPN